MMRRILTVDQATINYGYNIIEAVPGKNITWIECKKMSINKNKDTEERAAIAILAMKKVIEDMNITDLVVEDVPLTVGKHIKTMATLMRLLGGFEALAAITGVKLHKMNVNKWKSLAGIKSGGRDAQKSESLQIALKRWPQFANEILAGGDDVCDCLNMSYAWLKDISQKKEKKC